jgi:hypothetical protein
MLARASEGGTTGKTFKLGRHIAACCERLDSLRSSPMIKRPNRHHKLPRRSVMSSPPACPTSKLCIPGSGAPPSWTMPAHFLTLGTMQSEGNEMKMLKRSPDTLVNIGKSGSVTCRSVMRRFLIIRGTLCVLEQKLLQFMMLRCTRAFDFH